ncbi:Type II secretion system protein E [archaeon HR01]|nr:Type II secretion system protein E [archaeon HR01]
MFFNPLIVGFYGLRIVPDTSAIINGKITQMAEAGELKDAEIVIPVAVIDELQAQASKKREPGFIGLNELKKLREMAGPRGIVIRFAGERPSLEDIKLARSGRIDALIREVAKKENASLYTCDFVQALVAETEGISVRYFPPDELEREMSFEKYFTPDTLSLHLKEGAPIYAKRGSPGRFELVKISDEPLTAEDLNKVIREITEHARLSPEGVVEIMRSGAMVVQIGSFRIAVARPPFSDGLEVTVVRPIVRLRLEDYRLSRRLMERLANRAEGILIAGPPGSGKSTFAASLAEFYSRQGRVVKTLESPRDLQVGPEITQYGPLEGDFEKTAEILLLVRPDYTVFDEVRREKDFRIFADMRLAGVGMIGVVHASDAVGAIQRFIGRVELGMIPHIIDTVIFLKDGRIAKVYEISLVVRVPTGMVEQDLSRPLVEVRDFETGELEYEIYTYGEENVVIPVGKISAEAEKNRAKILESVRTAVHEYDPAAEVEMKGGGRVVVRVDKDVVPRLIGRHGENVARLEKELGVSLEVEPKIPTLGREIDFEITESGNTVNLVLKDDVARGRLNVYVDGQYLFSATVGKRGVIKVSKRSENGRAIINALYSGRRLRLVVTD